MTEYGIFNDEGCIESGLYDLTSAEIRLEEYLDVLEPFAYLRAICPQHEEQPANNCEECEEEE